MPRYTVTRHVRGDVLEDECIAGPLPHPTVYEGNPAPTGLVDHAGREIFKVADDIGFLAKIERQL